MKNLKKYEDFYLVNEESESTNVVIPNATVSIGGSNYDGKGSVYMPAGKYTAGEWNTVKFTIKNTSNNNLFIKYKENIGESLKPGIPGGFYFTDIDALVGDVATPMVKTKISEKSNPTITIKPGKSIEVSQKIKFDKAFTSATGVLFKQIFSANVASGATPYSKEAGKIVIKWAWNKEVSYF